MVRKQKKIKFGFPWEYLRDGAVELFKEAGYGINVDEHAYHIEIDDPEIECVTSKVEELASLVEKGTFDAGITEKVFILDSGAKVVELVDLNYGYKTWEGAKIVLAAPERSKIKRVQDLEGKKIYTWTPAIARDYFKKHKVKAEIEFTNVPAEAKCPALADGVIEFVNTGTALRKFNLKIIDVLMETSPWLIANEKSYQDKWKRKKIDDLAMLLQRARAAHDYSGPTLPLCLGKLDGTDLKIIQALFKNGRKSFVEIAQKTGLSPVGAKNRVERLLDGGVLKIQGLLSMERCYSVSANIEIEADKKTISKLIEKFEKSPLVYHLVKTSGQYNLLVSIIAPSLETIENFIDKGIRMDPGVKHIDVSVGELPIIPKTWSPPIS